MSTKNGVHYTSYVAGRWSRIDRHTIGDDQTRWWRTGVVLTPDGYVYVYSEARFTTFRFIWDGREFGRRENRTFTKRGLARIARRFAHDVIKGTINA